MAKKVGKIDTTTVLLIGGGVLAVILLTKKAIPALAPYYPPYQTQFPTNTGSSTTAWINLGTSLTNALSNIFG